jgi:inosine-uridine nucleoside N-ribohydrolase
MPISIGTADPETLGQTRAGGAGESANANVATAIDDDGFFALLTERLARL